MKIFDKNYMNHDFIHVDNHGNMPGYECLNCKLYVYFIDEIIHISMFNLSNNLQIETFLSCEECIIKNIIE